METVTALAKPEDVTKQMLSYLVLPQSGKEMVRRCRSGRHAEDHRTGLWRVAATWPGFLLQVEGQDPGVREIAPSRRSAL